MGKESRQVNVLEKIVATYEVRGLKSIINQELAHVNKEIKTLHEKMGNGG